MIQKTFLTITKEIRAEQIWKLMTNVDDWKRWDKSITASRLHGQFAAGSFFTLKPKGGPDVKAELLEVKAPSYFKDITKFPLARMYDEHLYENTPEGLKITSVLTMKGPLAFLWHMIVMKDLAAQMPEHIQEQIAEAKKL